MRCAVCGRDFNPRGFQVVDPGLGRAFDRMECAVEARESGLAPAALDPAPAAAPVAASAPRRAPAAIAPAAVAPAGVAASAGIVRAPLLSGGNLLLLAALTAGTVFLWLRVFSPGDFSIPLPGGSAEPSFERGTVPALIAPTEPAGPVTRPIADGAVQADGLPTTTSPGIDKSKRRNQGGGGFDGGGSGKPSGGASNPSSRPASTPLTPPVSPTPSRSAPAPDQPDPLPSPGGAHPSPGGTSGGDGGHQAPSLPTQPALPTLPRRD